MASGWGLGGARSRDLMVVAGLPAVLAGLGLCWLLTRPAGPGAAAVAGAVALGAAVVLVGLGALPTIGSRPSSRVIGVVAALWLMAVVSGAWLRTSDVSGVAPLDVDLGDLAEVLGDGAPEVIAGAAAVAVLAWAVLDLLTGIEIPVPVVAVLAAIGVLTVAISGHASVHAWGPVVVGAHALAAAWWCGTLAAMVLSLRGRSGWATTLPAFSQRAAWAVGVVAVTGVIAGLAEVGGLGEFGSTGYGRVLLAKLAGLLVLVGFGWWHRRRWVPAAGRHRISEVASIRAGVVEILLMAVVLGLAAGLSATSPG
ncbi:copper resistance D domain protein [Gordonia bronchialis DSM 43247]|uniref:Copper resistance D domain protein n=2 Tax=Gordonia bronchialis TaxID=2054 RepID=D0L517_GORB4|nr:CopD family protein [Gordonia bronchialis]ACY20469.1 copper resistance D domain protein [Gordonia bronchialis DSM 43247]STQ63274.1 Putative copper export protein [Gordonia bronchialis]